MWFQGSNTTRMQTTHANLKYRYADTRFHNKNILVIFSTKRGTIAYNNNNNTITYYNRKIQSMAFTLDLDTWIIPGQILMGKQTYRLLLYHISVSNGHH